MKTMKSTVIVTLLLAGVSAFILQTQRGVSQTNPVPAFSMHYAELNLAVPAGVTTGLQLPVLDRTVRISVTFQAENGEVSFGEVAAYYKSSTEECRFQVGGSSSQDFFNFPTFSNDSSVAFILSAGPNGTLTLENSIPSPGTLHVAFWY